MSPDLIHAFSFWREETSLFKKLLVGAVVTLLPVIGHMELLGYIVAVFRGVVDDLPDDKVLPDWEGFGDFFFKGLSLASVAFCYGIVFVILFMLFSLTTSVSMLASTPGENSGGGLFMVSVGGAICFYLFSLLFFSAASFYAQELEIGPCFNISEVIVRVTSMGKEYFIFIGIWTLACAFWTWFSMLMPWYVLGYFVLNFGIFFLAIVCFYGVAQLVTVDFHPELHDPLNINIESSVDIKFDGNKFEEDEYGNAKPGKFSASSSFRRPETSVTWSTDSYDADED